MIIFLNDDRAYLSWVRSHRGGYVLEARRKGHNRLVHRSTCEAVRSGKHRHWTTGQQLKACSMSLTEIVDWVRDTSGCELPCCEDCRPEADLPADAGEHADEAVHLTPLADHILNYVVETAIVHLTNSAARYRLTVGEVSECLHKTPAQLAQALRRLLEGDFITASRPLRRDGTLAESTGIWPTPAALRTVDGYATYSDQELHSEVERLQARRPSSSLPVNNRSHNGECRLQASH